MYYLILASTYYHASNRLFYDNDFICNSNKDADTINIRIKIATWINANTTNKKDR